MLLRFLETENFLSHKSTSVAFPESGIFLLSGPSGSGKSSFIIDAMAYALFGVVATRARKQQDLITGGGNVKMSVRTTFDFPGERRVTIARGLDERGASWAEVYDQKSTLLAEGSAPVARFIRSELGGMTWQQFYAAFVAKQSEISMLTSLRGAERKTLVQRMLGMRELEKTADVISENIRRFSAEAEQLENSLPDDTLLREEESGLLLKEIEGVDAQVDKESKELQGIRNKIDKVSQDIEPLKEIANRSVKRKTMLVEIEGLRSQIKLLEAAAARRNDANPSLMPELEQSLGSLKEEQEFLRERYRQAAEKEQLEQDLEKIDAFDSHKSLSDLQERIRAAKQKIEYVEESISLFEKRGSDLRLTGSCDLCRRPFASEEEREKVAQEIEAELEDKKKELRVLKDSLRAKEEELPEWKKNEQNKELAKNIQSQLSKIEEDNSAEKIAGQGKALGNEIANIEERLAACRAAKKEQFDPGELDTAKEKLTQLEERLPAEEEGLEKVSLLEKEKEKLDAEYARKEGLLIQLKRQKEELQGSLKRHRDAQQSSQREREKIERVQAKARLQEELQTYLRSYQKHLAHEIRPALEEIGSEMIRRVSGGQHRAIHLDDNYEIELETSSGERIASGMLSGGEAVRASICLRLALTRLVSSRTGVPVGFLVLDEPLPAQDVGHIERIMELLQSLRPFYQQQFVISHVGNLAVSEEIDYLLEFGGESVQLLRA